MEEEKKTNKKGLLIGLAAFLVVLALFFVIYKLYSPKKITEDPIPTKTPVTTLSPDSTENPQSTPESTAPVFEKTVTVKIVFGDQTEKTVVLETNAKSLRRALEEKNLISGTEGQFGLYVTMVDGVTADESKHEFWSFTKGGEMLEVGVDYVEIADGEQYEISLQVW